MALRVGVLIIGSLLWDNDKRERWRTERINREAGQRARVPIRYGRFSTGRKRNVYTMVFSKACETRDRLGIGLIVPCASAINSAGDLCDEADALAYAERLPDKVGHGQPPRWKAWGAVGLLVNPGAAIPAEILAGWEEYFRSHAAECELFEHPIPGEEAVISNHGLLALKWPTCLKSDNPVSVDLLLATPTVPKLREQNEPARYPTAAEIAAAYVDEDDPEYFVENVSREIRTADDRAIWEVMRRERPKWAAKYPQVARELGVH